MKKLKTEDYKALQSWWSALQGNRGDRAQLRRAQAPDDVLLTPAFARFLQTMPSYWSDNKSWMPLTDSAMVAAVLARVKYKSENDRISFARALAMPKEGAGKAVMSELRFQQLQKSHTEEDFFRRICRAIALLDGRVNITSLANDILHWLDESRQGPANKPMDRLAVRWASDYYAAFKE